MKLISVLQAGQPVLAEIIDKDYRILEPSGGWPQTIQSLAENWVRFRNKQSVAGKSRPLTDICEFLAPVRQMEKVVCVGVNYADHAREMGGEPPEIPVIFNKFPSAIQAHRGAIRLPAITAQVDFEAELVVVIGKPGKKIARESAMDHVFGYCCGNDVTARDWQKNTPGGQWLRGKTFDTFAPIGPMVVTADEIDNPHNLAIESRVNGQVMQSSNTSNLIFPIDELISHLSLFVTLKPGDLIFTGTPPGVGAGRDPQVWLQPGDRVEVEIEGLGVLSNPVVTEPD